MAQGLQPHSIQPPRNKAVILLVFLWFTSACPCPYQAPRSHSLGPHVQFRVWGRDTLTGSVYVRWPLLACYLWLGSQGRRLRICIAARVHPWLTLLCEGGDHRVGGAGCRKDCAIDNSLSKEHEFLIYFGHILEDQKFKSYYSIFNCTITKHWTSGSKSILSLVTHFCTQFCMQWCARGHFQAHIVSAVVSVCVWICLLP